MPKQLTEGKLDRQCGQTAGSSAPLRFARNDKRWESELGAGSYKLQVPRPAATLGVGMTHTAPSSNAGDCRCGRCPSAPVLKDSHDPVDAFE
jgi:hypothetical protein